MLSPSLNLPVALPKTLPSGLGALTCCMLSSLSQSKLLHVRYEAVMVNQAWLVDYSMVLSLVASSGLANPYGCSSSTDSINWLEVVRKGALHA